MTKVNQWYKILKKLDNDNDNDIFNPKNINKNNSNNEYFENYKTKDAINSSKIISES